MKIPDYHKFQITRDEYGGYTELSFGKKGYFHLHNDEAGKTGRWWLVDPLGNAFLSLGINHIETHRMFHSYNRRFWADKFGIDETAEREAYYPGIREKVKSDLAMLGMNTLGCHTDRRWIADSFVPYVKQVRFVEICHYMTPGKDEFHDVFAPSYDDHCRTVVEREVVPYKDDPFVLGYSMTDCPIFTELDAAPRINNAYGAHRKALPTWPNVLRNMDGSAPGKQAYVETIKKRYDGDIGRFNETYGTEYGSFDEILGKANWRPGVDGLNEDEVADNLAFLYRIVDQAYKKQTDAIRAVDPNHLILGDKLNGNTDTPDEIVKLADKYFDLIFYQYYAFWQDQETLLDRWSKLTDKPFFMGDSAIAIPTRNVPDPYGPHCGTQELRAERTFEVLSNAFGRSNFVGWSWCGWMDQWHIGESPLWKQHSGLQTPYGEFHKPMVEIFGQLSALMYERATSGLND